MNQMQRARRLALGLVAALGQGAACRSFDDNVSSAGGRAASGTAGQVSDAGDRSEEDRAGRGGADGGVGSVPGPVLEGGSAGAGTTTDGGGGQAGAAVVAGDGGAPIMQDLGGMSGHDRAGSDSGPKVLGGPAPGTALDSATMETVEVGWYEPYTGVEQLVAKHGNATYPSVFGSAGSRPYVLGVPDPCGTHAQATEFVGFGVVSGNDWYTSPNDLTWTWGLDEKYNSKQGLAPRPAVWNGRLVAFELKMDGDAVRGKFTVDWNRSWWKEPGLEIDFTPPGLMNAVQAFPVIGRWRREYGLRLGLYQAGKFYLDWDGDNAWSDADRVLSFNAPGTYPVAADFVPGGGDEVGVFADGTWYIDSNQNGVWDNAAGDYTISAGSVGSIPVVARNGWWHDCQL